MPIVHTIKNFDHIHVFFRDTNRNHYLKPEQLQCPPLLFASADNNNLPSSLMVITTQYTMILRMLFVWALTCAYTPYAYTPNFSPPESQHSSLLLCKLSLSHTLTHTHTLTLTHTHTHTHTSMHILSRTTRLRTTIARSTHATTWAKR